MDRRSFLSLVAAAPIAAMAPWRPPLEPLQTWHLWQVPPNWLAYTDTPQRIASEGTINEVRYDYQRNHIPTVSYVGAVAIRAGETIEVRGGDIYADGELRGSLLRADVNDHPVRID